MNNKEIELKFGIEGNGEGIYEAFSKIGTVSGYTTDHLDNVYFDTDEKELFAIRAGLRIRRADDFCEQTLKVKGENLGGLHKRQEYNLPLDRDCAVPNLEKFPKEAFPENLDLADIQSRLKSVCRINFTRRSFNLSMLDSVFEVAYDNGYIETKNNLRYPLCELEIELKESSVKNEDLLNLFSILCTCLATNDLPLLLEPFSKMHRASLLQEPERFAINLAGADSSGRLTDYIAELTSIYENLYGLFLIKKEPFVLIQANSVLETLLHSIKLLKRKNLPAFIRGRKEPVMYKQDLQIIYKLLKGFYKTCIKEQKKLLVCSLNQKQELKERVIKQIRQAEKNYRMFLIPLKLRQLVSMF
ncbi:MAG: inorganic triphosphatase [Succinivibrio sp.]